MSRFTTYTSNPVPTEVVQVFYGYDTQLAEYFYQDYDAEGQLLALSLSKLTGQALLEHLESVGANVNSEHLFALLFDLPLV